MNALYNHGVRQSQVLMRDLAQFELNLSTSPMSVQGSIATLLAAFRKTIKEYGDLVQDDEKHTQRLEKFRQSAADFQAKFDTLRQQRANLVHAESRLELLGRRHVGDHSLAANPDNPYDPNTLLYLEGLYKEKQSLGRGSQQLDMILEMGQSALDDLVDQNETLRRLGATFERSLMTLGVSQGTIRQVERRARQDKWLFWAALVVFFLLCYLILRYFH